MFTKGTAFHRRKPTLPFAAGGCAEPGPDKRPLHAGDLQRAFALEHAEDADQPRSGVSGVLGQRSECAGSEVKE